MDADHGEFYKKILGGIIIVVVHVDDGMVTGSSRALINKFKVKMDKKYKLTDLGPANWLLGIKISEPRYHEIWCSKHEAKGNLNKAQDDRAEGNQTSL